MRPGRHGVAGVRDGDGGQGRAAGEMVVVERDARRELHVGGFRRDGLQGRAVLKCAAFNSGH